MTRLKPTPLFRFILKQLMYEHGWRRIPRKQKKRLLAFHWRQVLPP